MGCQVYIVELLKRVLSPVNFATVYEAMTNENFNDTSCWIAA
jgi:hypothetical protein